MIFRKNKKSLKSDKNLRVSHVCQIQVYESYFWCYAISIPIKWNRANACKKYENIDPEFVRKVKKHFYVDGLNSGARSTEEGFEFYKKVKSRFSEASFNIKK